MASIPHLLHVDDSDDDRRLFAWALARSGVTAELHSVAGAVEALLFLNQLGPYIGQPRPALLILDLNLPRMDGRELLELLRANADFSSIPVVILSGSESYADIQRCRELHVEDYIAKPRMPQELVGIIASLEHWLSGAHTTPPDVNQTAAVRRLPSCETFPFRPC